MEAEAARVAGLPEAERVEEELRLHIYRLSLGLEPGWRALLDVVAERRRHVAGEGWTPEHDDAYDKGELARAAACYAVRSVLPGQVVRNGLTMIWPWGLSWWKPAGIRRCLVKAGALILAEIERLDRKSGE
jgi:hypothetical protein